MDQSAPVGRLARFLGRAMLPFGLFYLSFAVLYFGYHIANGRFGALDDAVYVFFAGTTALFLIIQGRSFRRDPRFQ